MPPENPTPEPRHGDHFKWLGYGMSSVGLSILLGADLGWFRVFASCLLLFLGLIFLFRAYRPSFFLTPPSEDVEWKDGVLTPRIVPPYPRKRRWVGLIAASIGFSVVASILHFKLFDGRITRPVIATLTATSNPVTVTIPKDPPPSPTPLPPASVVLKVPATVQFEKVEIYRDFDLLRDATGAKVFMLNMGPGIAHPTYFGALGRQIPLLGNNPSSKTEPSQVDNFANDLFKEFVRQIPKKDDALPALNSGHWNSQVSVIEGWDGKKYTEEMQVVIVVGGMIYTDQAGRHKVGACSYLWGPAPKWTRCNPSSMQKWETTVAASKISNYENLRDRMAALSQELAAFVRKQNDDLDQRYGQLKPGENRWEIYHLWQNHNAMLFKRDYLSRLLALRNECAGIHVIDVKLDQDLQTMTLVAQNPNMSDYSPRIEEIQDMGERLAILSTEVK